MNAEPRDLDRGSRCVCAHDASLHSAQSGGCLGVDLESAICSCTQFEAPDDISHLERVKIIRAQILALRNILADGQRRGLAPDEEVAFRKIAEAFAELSQTWRDVFGE